MILPRSIAERLVGYVPLSLGGQTWRLLATYGVLLSAQDLCGLDMLGSVEAVVRPSAKALQALLWAMMARCDDQITPKAAASMVTVKNLQLVHSAVFRAFALSMPIPEERAKSDSEPGDPQKAMGWIETRAAARLELGLSDDEWLAMTPKELHEFRRCRIRNLQREEFMFSRLTAEVINFSVNHPKEHVPVDKFMIHKLPKAPEIPESPDWSIGDQIYAEMGKLTFRGARGSLN